MCTCLTRICLCAIPVFIVVLLWHYSRRLYCVAFQLSASCKKPKYRVLAFKCSFNRVPKSYPTKHHPKNSVRFSSKRLPALLESNLCKALAGLPSDICEYMLANMTQRNARAAGKLVVIVVVCRWRNVFCAILKRQN